MKTAYRFHPIICQLAAAACYDKKIQMLYQSTPTCTSHRIGNFPTYEKRISGDVISSTRTYKAILGTLIKKYTSMHKGNKSCGMLSQSYDKSNSVRLLLL